ncbi:hypothetical protein [Lentibacillus sp. Marseille-P4043]|uniref:hypothetical protein n=1 Tax=Lentibacillus sp. Marseille-P4043 TaxID=2040293 RepID=UPI00131A58CE|nr:hypothetical protein [Lentibacillus sp. Marseille-P4043]
MFIKIEEYVNKGYISVDQGMIALGYHKDENIDDILQSMGLLAGCLSLPEDNRA